MNSPPLLGYRDIPLDYLCVCVECCTDARRGRTVRPVVSCFDFFAVSRSARVTCHTSLCTYAGGASLSRIKSGSFCMEMGIWSIHMNPCISSLKAVFADVKAVDAANKAAIPTAREGNRWGLSSISIPYWGIGYISILWVLKTAFRALCCPYCKGKGQNLPKRSQQRQRLNLLCSILQQVSTPFTSCLALQVEDQC